MFLKNYCFIFKTSGYNDKYNGYNRYLGEMDKRWVEHGFSSFFFTIFDAFSKWSWRVPRHCETLKNHPICQNLAKMKKSLVELIPSTWKSNFGYLPDPSLTIRPLNSLFWRMGSILSKKHYTVKLLCLFFLSEVTASNFSWIQYVCLL